MSTTIIPPAIPMRLSRLPRTPAGLPIPWFVAWKEGRYDFRVVDARKPALFAKDAAGG